MMIVAALASWDGQTVPAGGTARVSRYASTRASIQGLLPSAVWPSPVRVMRTPELSCAECVSPGHSASPLVPWTVKMAVSNLPS